MCDPWLSRNTRTGFLGEQSICFLKCFNKIRKDSSSIQPEGLANASHPKGTESFIFCETFTKGKTKTPGYNLPEALIKGHIVTLSPRSLLLRP